MQPDRRARRLNEDQPGRTPPRRIDLPAVGEYPSSGADDDVITLLDIWRFLSRYKWILLTATVLSTLASSVTALVMTPMYRTEVVLVPVTGEEDEGYLSAKFGQLGSIIGLAGIDLDRGDRKAEAIATLESRMLSEQFIKENKLLPVLFHDKWNEKRQRWEVDDPDDVPTLWDAYEFFDEKVRRVYQDRRTGLVILSIVWEDPDLAAQWGNELAHRTNAMLRERAAAESEQAIRYLREQLKQTSEVELKRVLNRLIESEMKEIILANINEEFAFRVIDPAVAPREAIRPKIGLMVALGAVLGPILGILLALSVNLVQKQRETLSPG